VELIVSNALNSPIPRHEERFPTFHDVRFEGLYVLNFIKVAINRLTVAQLDLVPL
jgi:hypothetical protein